MRLIRLLAVLLIGLCSPQLWAATCGAVFPASITGNSAEQFDLSGVAWQGLPRLGSSNRRLGAGDHYFGGGASPNNWILVAIGGVSTRVFVNGSLNLANNSRLNAGGNPQDLILIVNGSLNLGNNVEINGFVYVTGSVGFGNNLALDGAITATGSAGSPGGGGTSLNYNDAALDQADFASLCSPAIQPRLSWSLDESAWTGAANEVVDASGNGLNGSVVNGASTASSVPARATANGLGTCGYGDFDSAASQYVQRAHNNLLTLQDSFTIGLWVKPNRLPASGLMSIVSKDENYEFHLKPDGKVNWWWQTTGNATRQFDSDVALTPGQWSHVLIRFAPGDQRIYINGNPAGRKNFSGTPRANSDPLQLGADQNLAGRYFDGQLDELRIYGGALSEAAIRALVTESHQCELALQCFNDGFGRTSLGGDWSVASRGATAFTPTIASARMRLTSNQGNVATSSTLQRLFPAAGNYIQVQFKHYAYNGSGADGIAVVLSDASITPQPGAFGGPLGYGSRGTLANPGFAGGWLGVGIDEYGNFSTEGGPGGPGRRSDSVAMRGSGAEATGYRYIAGTPANLNPGIDNAASGSAAPGHTYRITMDGRVAGQALVTVERDSGAGFVVLPNLDAVNALAAFGQAELPANFFLSLTGSTGGSTNIHELDDLQVCATTINPIGQQVHHFEFVYSTPALTCNLHPITVRACGNADCSLLYTNPVSVTLAPSSGWNATGGASISNGNILAFAGGVANLRLGHSVAEVVTVGALSSAAPNSESICSTPNCRITYADSGFLIEVPNTLAAKPTPASIAAVRSSDDKRVCLPTFEGVERTISFTSAYTNPATGSRPVLVSDDNSAETATPASIALSFDATGRAPFSVRYDDAGLMTLSASYIGSEGTGDAGVALVGADTFVSKPVGLCVYSDSPNSDCASGTASCSAFVAAGDGFRLRVRGATWEADGDTDFCNNGTTPNYRQSGIALASSLIAPVGGASATLGTETVGIIDTGLGEAVLTGQSLSEVGVFTLSATPAINDYFGETVDPGTSANLGRFYPASFDLEDPSLTPACGISTYAGLIAQPGPPVQAQKAGQSFAFSGSLSARNRADEVTRNYTGDFAKLSGSDIAYIDPGDEGIVAVSGTALSAASAGNGYFDYSANDASFLFNAPRAPHDLAILTTATDSDGVTGSVTDAQTSDFRLGQARIGNAHGSELQDLAVPFTAAYFTGSGYAPNPLDSCSDFAAVTLGAFQRSDSGSGVPLLASGPYLALTGLGNYLLSAPGTDSSGSVPLTYAAPAWLQFDWNGDGLLDAPSGLATFGIYRGAAPLIFRRELYR